MRNTSWFVLVAAVILLPSCVTHTPRAARGWDPDSAVLPLRERPSADDPRSHVILLASADGTVGKVDVSTPGGSVTLNQALQAVAFDALDEPYQATTAEIDGTFRESLLAEPPAPIQFVVYFPLGSTQLTEGSVRVWQEILTELGERPVPEVSISGHADRVRSEAHNLQLSKERAEAIREMVVSAGVDPELVETAWYGETKPASPTADNLPEPLNRRAILRISAS